MSKFSKFGMELRGNKGCHVIVDTVTPLSAAHSLGFRVDDMIIAINSGKKLVGATIHSPHLQRVRAGELTPYKVKKKLGSSKTPIVVIVSRLDAHEHDDDHHDDDDNDSRDGSVSSMSSTESFHEGDKVTWKGFDDDVPTGTVGIVRSVHDDGDVEVMFGNGINAKMFTFLSHRIAHWSEGQQVAQPSPPPPPIEEDDDDDDFDAQLRKRSILEEQNKASFTPPPPKNNIIQRSSVKPGGRRGSLQVAVPSQADSIDKDTQYGNGVPTTNQTVEAEEEVKLAAGWVNGRWMSGAARAKLAEEEKAKGEGDGGAEEEAKEPPAKNGGWVDGRWVVERSSVMTLPSVTVPKVTPTEALETNDKPPTPTTQGGALPLFKLDDLFGGGGGFALGTLDRETASSKPRTETTVVETHFEIYATNVLVLLNIINPDMLHNEEEYEDILEDITLECKQFGDVSYFI